MQGDHSRRLFALINRGRRTLATLFFAGCVHWVPAHAGPLPFADLIPKASAPSPQELWTTWGFGKRENLFNDLIAQSVQSSWQDLTTPLPPVLYKSLVAIESSFNPTALSPAGAAGLTQLMPDTAKRFGLSYRDRFDPLKAVPAGIQAFQEKYRVISEPANYPQIVGKPAEAVPFSVRVADFYSLRGQPQGDERWHLALAAYNGGGGTVLRAMSYAIEDNLDPRDWDQVAGLPGQHLNSPLHRACMEVFGPRGGTRKVAELAAYPRKIMGLYRSTLASGPSHTAQ